MAYEDDLSGFIAAVKEEAARYGFVNFPLTDAELEVAYNEGLEVPEMYGVFCDVHAGLSFEEALAIAKGLTPAVSPDVRPEVIDVTPTWTNLLPVFRAILEDDEAPAHSQQAVWGEIERMARIADLVAPGSATTTLEKV